MRKFLELALVALLLVSCSKAKKAEYDSLTITDNNKNKVEYKIELAQTLDEMRQGLMNRESLDANAGMLFALGKTGLDSAMWMKNTKIPLDMIFIDKDGMIFWIYENAEPYSEKLIIAPYAPYAVLEVNAGDVKKYGIEIGDIVKQAWFKPEQTEKAVAEPVVEPDVKATEEKSEEATEDNAPKDEPITATEEVKKD